MTRTREEQISRLSCAIFNEKPGDIDNCIYLAREYILEAEQRGYERARAECAEDTKRLDFMNTPRLDAMKTSQGTWEIMSMSGDTAETLGEAKRLRSAIDAAMKEVNNV